MPLRSVVLLEVVEAMGQRLNIQLTGRTQECVAFQGFSSVWSGP
jgi:hypothetical protein